MASKHEHPSMSPWGPAMGRYINRCLKTLSNFHVRDNPKHEDQVALMLLTVECARLYTWALSLGILHASEPPKIVAGLSSYYRQQSISEALKPLVRLTEDAPIIEMENDCDLRPVTKDDRDRKTAAFGLAEAFDDFTTSTGPKCNKPPVLVKIDGHENFRLFVIEVRTLIDQIHGMTRDLLPCLVTEHMICLRLWRVKSSWTMSVLAEACDELYYGISLCANDLTHVFDIKDDEVTSHVRGFIECAEPKEDANARAADAAEKAGKPRQLEFERLSDLVFTARQNCRKALDVPLAYLGNLRSDGSAKAPVMPNRWEKDDRIEDDPFDDNDPFDDSSELSDVEVTREELQRAAAALWRAQNEKSDKPKPSHLKPMSAPAAARPFDRAPIQNLTHVNRHARTFARSTIQPRRDAETYTPSTSSAADINHRGRRNRDWDDTTSDITASENDFPCGDSPHPSPTQKGKTPINQKTGFHGGDSPRPYPTHQGKTPVTQPAARSGPPTRPERDMDGSCEFIVTNEARPGEPLASVAVAEPDGSAPEERLPKRERGPTKAKKEKREKKKQGMEGSSGHPEGMGNDRVLEEIWPQYDESDWVTRAL
jgi:hypothetical protein